MSILNYAREALSIEAQEILNASKNLGVGFENSVQEILNSSGRVIITGMGKSGIVGKKIAATLSSTGTPSYFVHPGEAYHGDLGMVTPTDVVILISNSGETEEVLKLLHFLRTNKNKTIAITGNSKSTLANFTDHVISIHVRKEACPLELAPTSSTTLTLAIGDAIAVSLMKCKDFKPEHFAKFHPGGSLGKKLLGKVSDLIESKETQFPTVSHAANFEEIVLEISKGKKGSVIVYHYDDNKIVGIITDGDIRRAFEKFKEKTIFLNAMEIASPCPIIISTKSSISDAENLMLSKKVNSLVCVSEKGDPKGLITLHDIQ